MILKLKRLWCRLFFHPRLHMVHLCSDTSWVYWCDRCDRYYGLRDHEFKHWTPQDCTCGRLRSIYPRRSNDRQVV